MIDKSDMLVMSNISYTCKFLGTSLGVFICGLMFNYGLRGVFGVTLIFLAIQIILAFILVNKRHKYEATIQNKIST